MTRFRMTCAVAIAVLAGLAAHTRASDQQSQEKGSGSKVRVGTFDSRAVAMAYFGSEAFKRQLNDMRAEYENAKAAGDEKRVKELDAEGPALQELMHKQGFSTWPVDHILEAIKKQIPEIAAKADVDVIVSKWDMVYQRSAETLGVIKDIQKRDPVPLIP